MKDQMDRVLSVYRAKDGWRWQLRYRSRVLADSGEAYGKRAGCESAARRYGVGSGFPVLLRVWNDRIGVWAESRLR